MKYIHLTLSTPQENLACDEALLDWCEESSGPEILRFWESPDYFVVLGYSNKTKSEVNLTACKRRKIPVLRRASGGGTVLQGPGSLNFSLILKIRQNGKNLSVTESNRRIMKRHQMTLEKTLGEKIKVEGITDLTIAGLKFSGNAQRRKRRFFLFHGTFLLDFDMRLIEETLFLPSKQPVYRRNRSHENFLTNLNTDSAAIKKALKKCWGASRELDRIPREKIRQLVKEKYSTEAWNFKF